MQVAMDDSSDNQRVSRSDGGGLSGGRDAEERHDGYHRNKKFPFGIPESSPGLGPFKGRANSGVFGSLANPPPGGKNHEQDAGAEAAEKHFLDRDAGIAAGVGDDSVKNQGQAGREQHAEGTGAGKQTEGVAF